MVVSADAEKQMGHDPYLVVVDELGSHTDDRLYVSLRSSLIKDPSARMRVISTMGGHEDAPMPTMRRRALEDGQGEPPWSGPPGRDARPALDGMGGPRGCRR